MTVLETYANVAGPEVVDHLRQLSEPLRGAKVVHVNSTRTGGGVAEILDKLVPLMNELGINTHWECLSGEELFYTCTKNFHNALQGNRVDIPQEQLRAFERVNAQNAEELRDTLEDADVVFIHDPQPAPLLALLPRRKGKWIWRCHIDISHPYRPVWRYLREHVAPYDASIFSLATFARPLPHPTYLIAPSIDPLSDKNRELPPDEVRAAYERFAIDPERPFICQVSRFDRFKDPLGVIQAYKLAKRFLPHLQLALAGGGATDDPEGAAVLAEVHEAAQGDPDIHVLLLPSDAHRTINALQRMSDIVLQKSTKEGFGLTVAEALWKRRPVIGGDTGGIRLQVVDHHTGFLVSTPEGAALRTRYLMHNPARRHEMGEKGHQFVRDKFLLTRQLREYLTLSLAIMHAAEDRIRLR
jgi:trehalose synthase